MENIAGIQASVALRILLLLSLAEESDRCSAQDADCERAGIGVLRDTGEAYGAARTLCLEGMCAEELLALIREASSLLEKKGAVRGNPERLRISADYRIFIVDRGEVEMMMQPLAKTIFIFFLKHPEGVAFKDMAMYEDELFQIYGRISGREDVASMKRSIRHLTDPSLNNVNAQRYTLLRSLSEYFDEDTVNSYSIEGKRGRKRRISLDRTLVSWE